MCALIGFPISCINLRGYFIVLPLDKIICAVYFIDLNTSEQPYNHSMEWLKRSTSQHGKQMTNCIYRIAHLSHKWDDEVSARVLPPKDLRNNKQHSWFLLPVSAFKGRQQTSPWKIQAKTLFRIRCPSTGACRTGHKSQKENAKPQILALDF